MHTARIAAVQVDVVRGQVREHLAPNTGARDQHVEAALAVLPVEGAEIHRHVAFGGAPVTDADEDDVTLITLDRFEVLDEERLVGMRGKEPFARRVLAA